MGRSVGMHTVRAQGREGGGGQDCPKIEQKIIRINNQKNNHNNGGNSYNY